MALAFFGKGAKQLVRSVFKFLLSHYTAYPNCDLCPAEKKWNTSGNGTENSNKTNGVQMVTVLILCNANEMGTIFLHVQ